MARRPTYTSGQVGMINVPNVDFVQYKAQANMFSDLENRLNTVTNFAIKAGTQDAVDRASRDMYENSMLRNLDLESMDAMTQSEFNKIVGGDDFTAYGKKAKAVATEIIQTNLALDAQTLMDNEYSASSLADEDSEELWKRLSGTRDGYVSSYLEATGDYEGAYNFGLGLDKSIRTLTNNREKEIITQRKQDNLYNYENTMTQSDTLIGFDAQDPYGSLTNQIAILELVAKQNDMSVSKKLQLRNKIQEQFYTSIADYFVPSISNIEENPIEAFNAIELAINMKDASKLEKLLGVVPDGVEIYDHTLSASAVSDLQKLFSDERFDDEESDALKEIIYNKIINPIEQQNKMFEEINKQQERKIQKETTDIIKLHASGKTAEANERREEFEQDTGIVLTGVDDYLKATDQRIGQTTPGLESNLMIAVNVSGRRESVATLTQLVNQNPKGVDAKDIREKANIPLNSEQYPDGTMLSIGGDTINNINRNAVFIDTQEIFRKTFSLQYGSNEYQKFMQREGYIIDSETLASVDYMNFLKDSDNNALELAYEKSLLDYETKLEANPNLTISEYFDENGWKVTQSLIENFRFKPARNGELFKDTEYDIDANDVKNILSNILEQHYQYNRLNYPDAGYKRGDIVLHFEEMFGTPLGGSRTQIPEVGGVQYNQTIKFNINDFMFTPKDFEELSKSGKDKAAQLEAIRNLKDSAEDKITVLNDIINIMDIVSTDKQFNSQWFGRDYKDKILSDAGINTLKVKQALREFEEAYLIRIIGQLDFYERGLM